MDTRTEKLWNSVVRGLTILKPYIGELDMDSVPKSFPNGTPDHSHTVYIGVILGLEDPNEEEMAELKSLGWIFDGQYVTLYHPNIYQRQK